MPGRLAALVAVVIWGFQYSIFASALRVVDAYHFSTIRFAMAAAVLVPLLWVREGRDALGFDGQLLRAIGYGTAGFTVFSIVLIEALGRTAPQNAALIVATGPIITQVVRWVLDGARPHPAVLGLAVVALAGLLLVITKGHVTDVAALGVGDLLAFAAVVGFSLYTYGAGRFPGWSPLRYTTLTIVGGAAVTAAVTVVADLAGVVHPPSPAALRSVLPYLVYIVFTISAILAWNVAIGRLGAVPTVLFFNLTPIVALLIAVARGTRIGAVEVVGAAITVGALVVSNVINRRTGPALTSPSIGS